MYSQLKAIMAANGYTVSEGEGWSSSDVEQFVAFSKYVLGAHFISPNQLLAYPLAFPKFVAAVETLMNGEVPVMERAPEPAAPAAAPVNEIDPPAAPEAAPVADDVLDVSGGTAPIDPPAQPEAAPAADIDPPADAPDVAPADEEPAEDEPADAPAEEAEEA